MKKQLIVQGLEAYYLPGAEFGKYIEGESAKWGKIIRESNLKQL